MPRNKFLLVAGLLLTLTLALAACGAPSNGIPAGQPPTGGEDLFTRITDSFELTMGRTDAGYVLGSFHLEGTGTQPALDENNQITAKSWTMSADISGNDIHFITTIDGETTEGYLMDGGPDEGGKGYSVVDGQIEEDTTFPTALTAWNLSPIFLQMPFHLLVAAAGPTAQGTENVESRVAEKYGVDSANAPVGTTGIVGGLSGVNSSRGTVWVDQQTGALLKAILDYEAKFTNFTTGEDIGIGNGHDEIQVSQIGQITVTLPQ